jgi:hypothetical protein
MSNPTTPFSWQMPTSTDLVTDLPADFEVFGQAVATSMADLLGGTTGQVLAKNTNADMDFVWVASASGDVTGVTAGTGITVTDPTGPVPTVTNAMATTITTNGDLIYGTGSGTFTRRGVGTTGQVLTVSGGIPTWATPSAGAFTLIATASPSAASTFSFTSIPATYKHLFVLVPELVWAATGQSVKMRFATGAYYSARAIGTLNNTGTFSYISERGESYFGNSNQGAAPIQKGYTSSGVFGDISSASAIWIYDYTNTIDRVVTWTAGGNGGAFQGIGIYDHNVAISNIDFQTTGSTVTGTAYLYGVN